MCSDGRSFTGRPRGEQQGVGGVYAKTSRYRGIVIEVPSQVLLMWEDDVDDSPVWAFERAQNHGHMTAARLGLSTALRSRLRDWNYAALEADDELSHDGEEVPVEVLVEAFELAALLQQELGDECAVWCLGGGPLGTARKQYLSEGGSVMVLAATSPRPGALWTIRADGRSVTPLSELDIDQDLQDDVHTWQSAVDRVVHYPGTMGAPAGAATRATGLALAGRLQRGLGSAPRVFFAGGGDPAFETTGPFGTVDTLCRSS